MTSITPSDFGQLPDDVRIVEDLLTGELIVTVRGRDEFRQISVPWPVYREGGKLVIFEVVQNCRSYLRHREKQLDAITAKLMS